MASGCRLIGDETLLLKNTDDGVLFFAAHGDSIRLLADSTRRLDDLWPGWASSYWREHSKGVDSSDQTVERGNSCQTLDGLYFLNMMNNRDGRFVESTSPVDVAKCVLEQSLLMDPSDKTRLNLQFKLAAEVARKTDGAYMVTYPHSYDQLPLVVEELLDHAQRTCQH
jgi:hypothetical protein